MASDYLRWLDFPANRDSAFLVNGPNFAGSNATVFFSGPGRGQAILATGAAGFRLAALRVYGWAPSLRPSNPSNVHLGVAGLGFFRLHEPIRVWILHHLEVNRKRSAPAQDEG